MRRVIALAAVLAAALMLAVFLDFLPCHDMVFPTASGIAGAGERAGEVGGDESVQSNIRRSEEEDIPEITSTTMADYLYLSHRERDTLRHENIWLGGPDTLDGRFHSNDTIYIQSGSYGPVFLRRVTTSGIITAPNHARFLEGWGYAPPVPFPDRAEAVRENAGLVLGTQGPDSLIQIVLDSTLIRWRKCGLRNIHGSDSIACYPTMIAYANAVPIPASGAVFVEGKVWISASRGRGDIMDGECPERRYNVFDAFISRGFEGQLTIGSSDTMVIADNLIYKHALPNFRVPSTIDSCADILGLVSEKFIMMHRQVRDTLYIHAALAAIAGSISVQDIYWYTGPGRLNPKTSLFIWGSLAQRNRGIIHTTYPCGSDCERGFDQKDFHYDVRLRANPPPHFVPALRSYDWAGQDTLRY